MSAYRFAGMYKQEILSDSIEALDLRQWRSYLSGIEFIR